ncbi:MAG: DUF5615 family PIN-like protein [Planctomycetes bacterium]|nr:DUF5615 family PIN-like protein [Planctomycetota bacterium]
MKFKLDENVGRRGQTLLVSAGNDVTTVREQGLWGAPDQEIFQRCQAEQRVLITLDHGFGNVLRFPPRGSSGLVILELALQATPNMVVERLRELLAVLESQPLANARTGSSSRDESAFITAMTRSERIRGASSETRGVAGEVA